MKNGIIDWFKNLLCKDKKPDKKVKTTRELKKELFGCLREATAEDYAEWLTGYIKYGGKINYYNKNLDLNALQDCYVAIKDFTLVGLYGVDSILIIVPKEIKFLGGEIGHSKLFFMKKYTASDKRDALLTPDVEAYLPKTEKIKKAILACKFQQWVWNEDIDLEKYPITSDNNQRPRGKPSPHFAIATFGGV